MEFFFLAMPLLIEGMEQNKPSVLFFCRLLPEVSGQLRGKFSFGSAKKLVSYFSCIQWQNKCSTATKICSCILKIKGNPFIFIIRMSFQLIIYCWL